jgi:hypothetical protein
MQMRNMTSRHTVLEPDYTSDPIMDDLAPYDTSRKRWRSWSENYESVLYFHKRNLLVKFDGLYWYWSSMNRDWVLDNDHAVANWNIRDLKYTSEKEAKKFIKNILVSS